MTLTEMINASLDNLLEIEEGPNSTSEEAVELHRSFNSPAVLAALEALPPAALEALKEAWEVCSAF